MIKVENKLQEWKSRGLVSESQITDIIKYEKSLPRKPWAQLGFLIFGITVIVIGIIAIVASNWQDIPDSVKLTLGFAFLGITAYGIYFYRDSKSILITDGLRSFFVLYCMAMIGLIAQVYHLQGDGYKTGILWSLITVLIVLESRNYFLPLFWNVIFSLSVIVGLEKNYFTQISSWGFLLLFFASAYSFFYLILQKKMPSSFRKGTEFIVVTSWLSILSFFDVKFIDENLSGKMFAPAYLASAFLVGALFLNKTLSKFQRHVLIAGVLLTNVLCGVVEYLPVIVYIIGAMLSLFSFSLFFISRSQSRLFNLVLAIIGLKVFEIYVRQFKSLLLTGFGMVFSGLVILALLYGWNKYRHRFENWLQGMI